MSSNADFLAKAQAATQRVAASAQVQQNATPEQARIVSELAQDRPTIHAAVTSFLSLVAARSLVTPEDQQSTDLVLTNTEALQCSRVLLKAINATTLSAMPTTKSEQNEEYHLVAQLWNGLIASEQKPARFLGRRAMKHAWGDVKPAVANEEEKVLKFTQEFERLLFFESNDDEDNDAALIWDSDGGKAELQRRRERREKRAKAAAAEPEPEEEKKLPFIEELPEGNEEEPAMKSSSE